MTDRQLLSGGPIPEDRSHAEIDPSTGMQKDYIVLSPEERAGGFLKPVRLVYVHKCDHETTTNHAIAETYARNPRFYTGTFCCFCRAHFPLDQFKWLDGEPMDPSLQDAWKAGIETSRLKRLAAYEADIEKQERALLALLKEKYP